jgi:hypothetical protein
MTHSKTFGAWLVGPILVVLSAGCSSQGVASGTGSSSGNEGEMSGSATAGTGSVGPSGTASAGKSGSSSGSNGSGASGASSGSHGSGASGASSGSHGSGSSGEPLDGGPGDGSSSEASLSEGGFTCPAVPGPGMPVPGTCVPPADIRCPYPKLSQTGCIDPNPFSNPQVPITMASAVVPYEVNSPLWSDGAYKIRGMRLPATGLKIHVKNCVADPAECCVWSIQTPSWVACLHMMTANGFFRSAP